MVHLDPIYAMDNVYNIHHLFHAVSSLTPTFSIYPQSFVNIDIPFIEWLSYLCRYATYGPEYVYPQVYGTPSWLEQSKFTYFEGLMFLLCWLLLFVACYCLNGRVFTIHTSSTFQYMEYLGQSTRLSILMGNWVKQSLEAMLIHQCRDMECLVIRLCSSVDQI